MNGAKLLTYAKLVLLTCTRKYSTIIRNIENIVFSPKVRQLGYCTDKDKDVITKGQRKTY